MKKYKRKLKINKEISMNYYIYTPSEVKENMPVLLFLHGIGERGSNIEDIEKYALPKYMNKMDVPCIVVAPQCLENNFWDYHLRDIEKILDKVYKKYRYDKKRVCILGSSMGAYGAWNYIMQRPNLFKGIVSVSGGIMLPIDLNISLIKDKAILIYHGMEDDIVDVNESISSYDKLKKNMAINVELKLIEKDNHFLTSHAFKDSYLYEWLGKNI